MHLPKSTTGQESTLKKLDHLMLFESLLIEKLDIVTYILSSKSLEFQNFPPNDLLIFCKQKQITHDQTMAFLFSAAFPYIILLALSYRA